MMNRIEKHTADIAKLVRSGFKRELGALSVAQNYKGTGSQAGSRQLWCRFSNGAVIDIWIGYRKPRLGGVVRRHPENAMMPFYDIVDDYTDPEAIYAAIFNAVKAWLQARGEASC